MLPWSALLKHPLILSHLCSKIFPDFQLATEFISVDSARLYICRPATQTVVLRPAALALPRSLQEMQSLRPPRVAESQPAVVCTLRVGQVLLCDFFKQTHIQGLPRWLSGKEYACQQVAQETQIQFLGREDPLAKKWQPTLVFLPGRSRGQRSLVGYSAYGFKNCTEMSQSLAGPDSSPQRQSLLLFLVLVSARSLSHGLRKSA